MRTSLVPPLSPEQEEEASEGELSAYNEELRQLVNAESDHGDLKEQLRDGELQLAWERRKCRRLTLKLGALEARIATRDRQREELLRQATSLQQTTRECGERVEVLQEEMSKARRQLPGLDAVWPRLGLSGGGRTSASAGATAQDLFAEVRRVLADAPKPYGSSFCGNRGRGGSSGGSACGGACGSVLRSVPPLLPCVAWSATFCFLLDALWGSNYGSPPHWLLFGAAHTLAVMCLALQTCGGADGGHSRSFESGTASDSGTCSSSGSGGGETARLLGGHQDRGHGILGSDPGGGSSLATSGRSSWWRWRPGRAGRPWPQRLRHAQLPLAVLALLHVAYLGLFAAAYPSWCSVALLRMPAGANVPPTAGWPEELGLECGPAGASGRRLGLGWAGEAASWLAPALPVCWALAWFGVAREAGIADSVGAILAAAAAAAGGGSERGQERSDQPLRAAPSNPPMPHQKTPAFEARCWWRLRHRAVVAARFWTDFWRASLVLAVDAFDCMDLWQCAALDPDLVAVSGPRAAAGAAAAADGAATAAAPERLLYSDVPSPGAETLRRLRLACLIVALGNLTRTAVTPFLSDLLRGGGGEEDVVVSPENRHDLFLRFLRGDLEAPPRNTRAALVAITSALLVDVPLLALRIGLKQVASVGPSVLVTKNIVGLLCHSCTAFRWSRWRWRLRGLRRRHARSLRALEGQLRAAHAHEALRGPREAFFVLYAQDIGGPLLEDPMWQPEANGGGVGGLLEDTESDEEDDLGSGSSCSESDGGWSRSSAADSGGGDGLEAEAPMLRNDVAPRADL